MKVEFVHCADLHLGCNSDRIEERYNDFFISFADVIEYTHKSNIKYLLISGDFFHLKVLNSKTLRKTIELLELAKTYNISTFVIEGNHDKAFYVDEESWLSFLAEQNYITLLTSYIVDGEVVIRPHLNKSGSIFEKDEIRIIGLSYLGATTEKYLSSFNKNITSSKKPTILMLHAAVERLYEQDMADIKKETLITFKEKVNYIALGHIHNRYEYDNFLFNTSSIKNIRVKDGEKKEKKGYYHVVIEDGVVSAKHIESLKRKVYIERIDVSSYLNPNDFTLDIIERPFNFESKTSVIIQIYGKVDYNALTFDTKFIAEKIKTRYDLLYIDVINSVNIIKSASENKTLDVDISSLVKNEVINSIKFYYPQAANQEKLAKKMMSLASDMTDNKDFADIVARLDKEGDEL